MSCCHFFAKAGTVRRCFPLFSNARNFPRKFFDWPAGFSLSPFGVPYHIILGLAQRDSFLTRCLLTCPPANACVCAYVHGKFVFHFLEICPAKEKIILQKKTKGKKDNKGTPKMGRFKINRDGFCKSMTDLDRASVRHSVSCQETTSPKSYEYY